MRPRTWGTRETACASTRLCLPWRALSAGGTAAGSVKSPSCVSGRDGGEVRSRIGAWEPTLSARRTGAATLSAFVANISHSIQM